MKKTLLTLALAAGGQLTPHLQAAELFPLSSVRLGAGPFLDAQMTDLQYLMAFDPEKLLAPFRREAGLPQPQPSYGNWESTGLDGHMGGHYLSALALMVASTGDAQVRERLDYVLAELQKCQEANGNGYLGGIPDGSAAWQAVARGEMQADTFSVNGRWVPWYNLHKVYAGLRDAYQQAGSAQAKTMLIALSDWAVKLSASLSDEQMQAMLRAEHGGMNEVLADVYSITGEQKYLDLAVRFSHQAVLQPLAAGQDKLTGLHANTQIPKVIGFERIGGLTGRRDWQQAAQFFWQTVHDKRTVAIGGNSVKEHFHDEHDFSSMVDEVEGPETCNTYNMLKLTEQLFKRDEQVKYTDYYERALYNHILSSQRPGTGGFVYFTPMRPNHYRVYSEVDKGMWCCVGSGIESQAKYGEFIYAHDGDALYVNLFMASTLDWKEQGVSIVQSTQFPDQDTTRITLSQFTGNKTFSMKIRYPQWVAKGKLRLKLNGKTLRVPGVPGQYVTITRAWKTGDTLDVTLPMTTRLEQMPDQSNYYAVLHGPIVLAAKTQPFANEKLNYFADDTRMGHIAQGQVCPLESSPLFVSDSKEFMHKIKPVKGQPLTFTAPGLIQGKDAATLKLIPFFRLHDARYMLYWPVSTPAKLAQLQESTRQAEAQRLALDAQTIDQVAPGQQQPESDHFFKAEGGENGINKGRHWRHATGWFSYDLSDPKSEATTLRLTLSTLDAGRTFEVLVNGTKVETVAIVADAAQELHTIDIAVPKELVAGANGKLTVKFVAGKDSVAGGLYGLRLLR